MSLRVGRSSWALFPRCFWDWFWGCACGLLSRKSVKIMLRMITFLQKQMRRSLIPSRDNSGLCGENKHFPKFPRGGGEINDSTQPSLASPRAAGLAWAGQRSLAQPSCPQSGSAFLSPPAWR